MKNNYSELSIEQQTVMDCPILYRMRYRPCTETTMCWGWEFNHGWDKHCQDMSYELETLNRLFYPKYRVRIQMDQLKEKFGYYTAYYSIVMDHGKILTSILNIFQSISDFCLRRNFKTKYVVDVEPYDYDETKEISKEEYDIALKEKIDISNVSYVEENGTYRKITRLRNYGKRHVEPTINKLWWYLGNHVKELMWKLDYMFDKKETSNTRRIVRYLDTKANEIISKTEKKCSRTCEICGHQIGTEWSPTCTTMGWITNICEDCAKKQESNYTMNGKVYNKGIEVKKSKKSRK